MTIEQIIAVVTLLTGGGVVGAFVAIKKDRRENKDADLDFTKQLREIAREEVEKTQLQINSLESKVGKLEKRIAELEDNLSAKEKVIKMLVEYIHELHGILTRLGKEIPEAKIEIKEYIGGK